MDDLFRYYKAALTDGLCNEYKDYWRRAKNDKEQLVKLALQQQSIPHVATYMYRGDGVSKDYLLKEFGEYLNGRVIKNADNVEGYTYAWFVDYDYDNDLNVEVDVAHISHTVGTSVVIPKTKCPILYITNRSKVHIVGEGFNSLSIYLFDESQVTIEDMDENSNVVVYKYSDDAKVELGKYCLGSVKVFPKELRL